MCSHCPLIFRLLLVSCLTMLWSCDENRSLPTSPEQISSEMQRVSEDLVEVLKTIRDSDTAKAAEVKIAALQQRLEVLYQQARELGFSQEQMRELRASAQSIAGEISDELQQLLQSPEVREAVDRINRLLVPDTNGSGARNLEEQP